MLRLHRFLICWLALGSPALFADDAGQLHVDINSLHHSDELQPVEGLTTAGQPDEDAFRLVAGAGYEAVIDLRGDDEPRGLDEAALLEELGLEYERLPITDAAAVNAENAARLDELLAQFDGPVLIHCASGNRVGALLALRKSQQGADDDAALAYGRKAGLASLEPVVRERLQPTNVEAAPLTD